MKLIGAIHDRLTFLTGHAKHVLVLAYETGSHWLSDRWLDELQKDLRDLGKEVEKAVTMYDTEKLSADLDEIRDVVEAAYELDEEDRIRVASEVANKLMAITTSVGLHREQEESHPVFQAGLMIIEDDSRPLEAIREDWEALDRLVEPCPGKSILERVRSALEKGGKTCS